VVAVVAFPARGPEKEPVRFTLVRVKSLATEIVAVLFVTATLMFRADPVMVRDSVLRFITSVPVDPEIANEEAIPVRLDPSPSKEPENEPENLGAKTEPVILTVPVKM
jgi:hypothetical protein